ncbi:MAG: 3-deoxy-8-phosphooctulonate synthase [Candidatus Riflebacteria bacterium]|nr:3-deoxy-8-phosphooctulonate synthase [Candidatus Riflebacteria bacterium]
MNFSIKNFSESSPFFVIAGPCVIENEGLTLEIAHEAKKICRELNLPLIFKASYDKANRTSRTSFRGPGIDNGLKILEKVAEETQLPLLTDVHSPEQAETAAKICSILQIPAFLCRQTDILLAAAEVSRTVNVKKGQFLSPNETKFICEKLNQPDNACNISSTSDLNGSEKSDKSCNSAKSDKKINEIILTERGTTFGYGNLVVDMRSFSIMKRFCTSVVFDCTHSLQMPGGSDGKTSGQREFIPHLARAAMATGDVDGVFLEIHPEPHKSPSDADNILPLSSLKDLLSQLIAIKTAIQKTQRF